VTDAGLTRALEHYFRLMSMNGAVHVYREALRAGLLDALRDGAKGSADAARACGLAERPVALLLPALAELGLVDRDGEAWEITPLAHGLLAGSYRELGDPYWRHLGSFLRTATPVVRMDSLEEGEAQYQAQAAALAWMQGPLAEAAASVLGAGHDLAGAEILDVGAGSAIWSLTLARHAPGARVTAVDWPAVLAVARATAERLGLAERLTLRPGSYHEVELPPAAFDLAILANVTHLETPEGNRALLRRVRRALELAGRVAIVDVMPGLPAGDLSRVLSALGLALRTEHGHVYTPAELGTLLAETGFGPARLVNLDAPPYAVGMLVATPV
jgi:2-polyprenyl-3-methyl-5-hydroxy-6-metoxy-1,4-benzoquinol methylase